MQIDPTRFRNILSDLIDSNPLACRGVLGLCAIEFTDRVDTLAVTLRRPSMLRVNLEFVRSHCQTETEVKALLVHEFLHVLLRHTERLKRMTPALNVALDAAINSIIHRKLGPDWSDFMRRYYRGCTGLMRLLRPMRPEDLLAYNAARKTQSARERRQAQQFRAVWAGIYQGSLLAEDVFAYCRQFNSAQLLDHGRMLLGNHDGGDTVDLDDLDPFLADRLRNTLRSLKGHDIWRDYELKTGCVDHSAMVENQARLAAWRPIAWAAIRECLTPDATHRAPRGVGSNQSLLPILRPSDRRGALRAIWNPLLPLCAWELPDPKPQASAQVYLDVSASMEREMRQVLALLLGFLPWIRQPFWAFSTVVEPARMLNGRLVTNGTGNTSINVVLDHILRTRPERALIVTDGFVEQCEPWLLCDLGRIVVTALIVPGGNAGQLEADGILCRNLDPTS